MTGEEMVRYINQLSSSVHEQSHDRNTALAPKLQRRPGITTG